MFDLRAYGAPADDKARHKLSQNVLGGWVRNVSPKQCLYLNDIVSRELISLLIYCDSQLRRSMHRRAHASTADISLTFSGLPLL